MAYGAQAAGFGGVSGAGQERWTPVYRSQLSIVQDYAPPTVTNVIPAPGTPLAEDGYIQLDVLDDSGAPADVTIVAEFAELQLSEGAVYQGRFGLQYEGSRVDIAGGYRFQLRRRGGWPASPVLIPIVHDPSGNVNA